MSTLQVSLGHALARLDFLNHFFVHSMKGDVKSIELVENTGHSFELYAAFEITPVPLIAIDVIPTDILFSNFGNPVNEHHGDRFTICFLPVEFLAAIENHDCILHSRGF